MTYTFLHVLNASRDLQISEDVRSDLPTQMSQKFSQSMQDTR
jgi:hypothetical protein